MKILIIVIVAAVIIWTIASWIAIRNIEEPQYQVISSNNVYEVRQYQPYIIAETTVSGTYDEAMSAGFRNIADYIFGNNTSSEKIAMTAPVADDLGEGAQSEKIAMTVPVIAQGDATERTISFVMPSKYTFETIPKPNTSFVLLREIQTKKVAVLRYSWYTNEKRIKEKSELLLNALTENGVSVIGNVSSARYNPPFSIPLLLRNEVMVEIE